MVYGIFKYKVKIVFQSIYTTDLSVYRATLCDHGQHVKDGYWLRSLCSMLNFY